MFKQLDQVPNNSEEIDFVCSYKQENPVTCPA